MKVASGWSLRCMDCSTSFDSDPSGYVCSKCGGLLQLWMEKSSVSKGELFGRQGEGIWRFRVLLPVAQDSNPISLREGGTPLVKARNLGKEIGLNELYFKNEGQNPTGSFKDRGMTVSVTRAILAGARVLICASTGNTSASMAAYAARAGVIAAVVVPAGKVAAGKLVQAIVYGAAIIKSEGNFDEALSLTRNTATHLSNFAVMNSVNPYRIEGQKTTAFEIYEQLGYSVPDYVVLPVGNAGNISAIWKGFKELKSYGITDELPRMVGVQAEGAAPIARAFWKGADDATPISNPNTVASAIRIGNPASAKKALLALKESDGMVLTVSDQEIVRAREMLASREGLFVEPASATPLAALKEIAGRLEKGASVVCIATGNGLKDQESIETNIDKAPMISDGEGLSRLLERLESSVLVSPRAV